MNTMLRVSIAVGLVLAAALTIVGVKHFSAPDPTNPVAMAASKPYITVRGYYGGEKEEFLQDPEVKDILANDYHITINASKAGSVEMVQSIALTAQDDFLWPSSQVSLAIYKERGGTVAGSDNIFNSPMVIYTWVDLIDPLTKAGVVQKRGDVYYVSDMPKLVAMIAAGKRWSEPDIGFKALGDKARISLRTSDPRKSNSGFILAGLLASVMNGGDIPDDTTISGLTPKLNTFFVRLGFMEQSSKDLFQGYLTQGMGSRPMIAGYESQLVEYVLQHPADKDAINQTSRVLYPEPTVWSSHPFIARDANGKRLMEALKDPRIQEIAWKKHGFRSGLPNIVNDPKAIAVTGMPARIGAVVDMPSPKVMETILNSLDSAVPTTK